jgi:hypothetical protein
MKKSKNILRFLFVSFIAIVLSVVAYTGEIEEFLGVGSGVSIAIVAVANIGRGTAQQKAGNQTGYRVYLLPLENANLSLIPKPDTDNQTLADIPLEAGGFWFYLDAKKSSVIPQFASEGDDGLQVTKTIEVMLEGLESETRKFLDKNKGGDFILVWELCVTGEKFIAGTSCSALTMTISEGGWLAERTGATITFTSTCSQIPYKYLGTTTTQAPSTVAADATVIPLASGNNNYQLTTGTIAAVNVTEFSGMAAADHLRVVKILGSGGAFPSTIDNDDDFILKDGATWTANAGAALVVQIYKDGAATYKFVELSRVTT